MKFMDEKSVKDLSMYILRNHTTTIYLFLILLQDLDDLVEGTSLNADRQASLDISLHPISTDPRHGTKNQQN